ncbi:MAG TPA: FAD:protein FMN transferase, partial [Bryobacteraceae bacterium]|nr:FAD:protein FMN transferase [Bryobacteraceae bacterium]
LLLWLLPLGAQSLPAPTKDAEAASAGQAEHQLLRLEESLDAMGSTYSIALYGYDEDRMEAAIEAAFNEVRRLDHLLSNYRSDSELTEVNRNAAAGPVKVTPELFELLANCQRYSRESEGAFDITVGPLMKVWGFYKGTGHLPSKAEVSEALKKVGYRNVILDAEHRTVRFSRPGVELDPGGIGKGYAVDRIVDVLKENGIESALISAGGSSIYALGTPNNESRGWEVKIRDPKDPRKTVEDLYLKNQSMSTSGNYEKFFEAEGRIYSHVMDPRTGFPAEGMLSVSVITPSTLDSEAWTKPYFILGRRWAAQHKPADFRVYLCEDRAEQPCAWLQ